MESTAKEMMRNYVDSQKFSSTAESMEAMKDLFRDALQQVMEGELEEQLGSTFHFITVNRTRKDSAFTVKTVLSSAITMMIKKQLPLNTSKRR